MPRPTTILLAPAITMFLAGGLASQTPPVERQAHTQPQTQEHRLAPASTNNTALTGAVMQKLITDPLLKNYTITIDPGDNGVVTLNGVVPAADLEQRAVAVVSSVPGVSKVDSKLLVVTDPFAAPTKPPAGGSAPIGAAPAAPAAPSLQMRIADAYTPKAEFQRVGVRVAEDEILLYGSVTTKAARKQAEAVAHQLAPQLPVYNIIWVDEHPIAPPPVRPGG